MLKKVLNFQLVVFALACMIIVFAKNDVYAADCLAASVDKVGPLILNGKTGVVLTVINKSGITVGTWAPNTRRQFYLHETILNQGLATVLTAYSMNRTIFLRTGDSIAADGSLVTIIYINK